VVTQRKREKPNIIENQNFKVNTAAVWQQEGGKPGAIEELSLNKGYLGRGQKSATLWDRF